MKNNSKKRELFKDKWNYKEGFVVSLLLINLALALSYSFGETPIEFPKFPLNLTLLAIYAISIWAIYKFFRETQVIKWLSSVPAAISSTVLVAVLASLLGFLPQYELPPKNPDVYYILGFTHLTTSWLFVLGYLFFVTTLGFATVKMFYPFRKKRIGTILNHLGLFLVILSAVAGSGDIKRGRFIVFPNQTAKDSVVSYDFAYTKNIYKLPFKVKLNKFDIQEYNPKIVLVERDKFIYPNNLQLFTVKENKKAVFKNNTVRIVKYLPKSIPANMQMTLFKESENGAAYPSALIVITDTKSGRVIKKGYLSVDNTMFRAKTLNLDNKYYFVMYMGKEGMPPFISMVERGKEYRHPNKSKKFFHAGENKSAVYKNWKLNIKKYYKYALPADSLASSYIKNETDGASPVVYAEIEDIKTNKIISKGWFTSGSYKILEKNLDVNNEFYFAMYNAEPREYSSQIEILKPGHKNIKYTLKVNHPLTIDGWTLYQLGYENERGKWSRYSTIEATRDPWLWAVYVGIYMILLGAIHIFWVGQKFTKEDKK